MTKEILFTAAVIAFGALSVALMAVVLFMK
jgi:hypothetical protein